MKNLKKVIIGLVALLFMGGCEEDFLVKSPPDALTEEGYYNSAERALLGVNAIYASVADEWDRELYRINTVVPGEMDLTNTEPLEYNNFSYHPAVQELQFIWTNQYDGINKANAIIAYVPNIDMDTNLKNRYLGEARFLRALNYFTISNLWGDVPLLTEPFKETDDVLIARSPLSDIYDLIIKDLEFARANLPYKSEYGNNDLGRATWGAATSLLGKVYLYRENYQKAYDMFKEMVSYAEANPSVYGLMDDYDHIWNRGYENNKESIFEVQYADIGGGGSSELNSELLPIIHGTCFPTQKAVDAFRANDPRLGYSIFRDGDPYAPNFGSQYATFDATTSATGYVMRKSVIPVKIVNGGDTNIPLIRYADVLLMFAEAANELDLRDDARDAINQVRQRSSVNLDPYTVNETDTYQEVFDAIVYERTAELMFEGHRFNDLRRWGLAADVLSYRGYKERNRYFPIPQLELDINPQLTQNPKY